MIAPRCCTSGLDRSANAHRFLPSAGTSQVHLPLPGPACSSRITRRVGYRITITVRKGLGIGFSLVVGRWASEERTHLDNRRLWLSLSSSLALMGSVFSLRIGRSGWRRMELMKE